jgi:hypothetical protein
MAAYGILTTTDYLENNHDKIKADWNSDTNIKHLWTRAMTCKKFAEGTSIALSDEAIMIVCYVYTYCTSFFGILFFKRRYSATKLKAVPFLCRILHEQRQLSSMLTPSLAPVVEGTEDTMDINPTPSYNYNIKIEFMLKSPGETVYAKAIMVKTMKAIQSTICKGKFVTFHDIHDSDPVHPELQGIVPEERADKFCFEVGGSNRSIAFSGFILQSNISFQVLNKRTFDQFKKTNTFMRLQSGGFGRGIHSSTLGFILKERPIFTDVNTLRNNMMTKVATPWSNDSNMHLHCQQESRHCPLCQTQFQNDFHSI